jgi:adenylate cyclase
MSDADIASLASWVTNAGLAGKSEPAMLTGFCERVLAMGIPLKAAGVFVDTLHPVHEGRMFRWRRGQGEATLAEYGRTKEDDAAYERWRRSPFFRLLETGGSVLRTPVTEVTAAEFPVLADLLSEGLTEYMALVNRFAAGGIIGDMDCVYSSWATDAPGGFSDAQVATLQRLKPFLALAIKSASLARIAGTLVETYLGRDAGRRVLGGKIARGVAEPIDAVLWFSDLQGFTRITDTAQPAHIIPLLNDYAEVIVSTIHAHGGDVLKLIGDGVLAIFPAETRAPACQQALAAALAARAGVGTLNARRIAEETPTTDMYLGLHVGEVFYGNIGSHERLDFTVVGPAVNEVSRIAALCRSVDQPLLMSQAFAASLEVPQRVVSVGRYALRGVGRPQDLFTTDPDYSGP